MFLVYCDKLTLLSLICDTHEMNIQRQTSVISNFLYIEVFTQVPWTSIYPSLTVCVKCAFLAIRFLFDFIECFTTTFLHAHSWLNWVDEDDDEEDTRYIKKITSKQGNSVTRDLPPTGLEANTTIIYIYIGYRFPMSLYTIWGNHLRPC